MAAGVELTGAGLLLFFRASSNGLGAAGAEVTLLLGLGSRLMTGMEELEAMGRGAARRLLRVVVLVELVEEAGLVEVVGVGVMDFSGSGAKKKKSTGWSEAKDLTRQKQLHFFPLCTKHFLVVKLESNVTGSE